MRISADQITLLRVQREDQREERLAKFLRERHGHLVASLSDEELRGRIRDGVRRAGVYGINWDSSLALFIIVMLSTAPTFDQHPSARAILTNEYIEPNRRVHVLVQRIPNEVWTEIARHAGAFTINTPTA